MTKLLPDQSFYPSPKMAMEASPEKLAYVAMLNPKADGSDALAVVDLDQASKRWLVAGILAALGLSRLWRHRHPRWASMRVGAGALTLWSFLMASAHGAGLMVVPVYLGMTMAGGQPEHHHAMAMAAPTPSSALLATTLHAAGYLMVTAIIALLVFEKLGVGMLRKAWFNLDLVWAVTLIGTGLVSIVAL